MIFVLRIMFSMGMYWSLNKPFGYSSLGLYLVRIATIVQSLYVLLLFGKGKPLLVNKDYGFCMFRSLSSSRCYYDEGLVCTILIYWICHGFSLSLLVSNHLDTL